MSEQHDPPQPNASVDDRARRIQALHDLAVRNITPPESDESPSSTFSASSPVPAMQRPWQTPVRRSTTKLVLAGISALVLVGIAGGLIAHNLSSARPSSSQHAPTAITFAPAADNLTCLCDVVWSPDGTTVAMLGYQRNCAFDFPWTYAYHPGTIKLFSAATGYQIATLLPDPIIAAALHLTPPAMVTPNPGGSQYDRDTSQQAINYAHLLWSPDGKRLAVTFSVLLVTAVLPNGGFQARTIVGVLLSDLSGAQTRVLSHTLARGEEYSGLWNLADGTYIPPGPVPSSALPAITSNN